MDDLAWSWENLSYLGVFTGITVLRAINDGYYIMDGLKSIECETNSEETAKLKAEQYFLQKNKRGCLSFLQSYEVTEDSLFEALNFAATEIFSEPVCANELEELIKQLKKEFLILPRG